ncbi:MAG: hypothetical protein LBQ20_05620 [Rhodanobacter sp.]|jgi:hypothetical protein|nr:hypothetical protein [Rhodanobacter sp.]
MKVPSSEFLDSIEHLYSVKYPRQYRELCVRLKDIDLQPAENFLPGRVDFISDIETFWAVNVRVGEEQCGDYERAIIGKELPKDKNILWGEILPFSFTEDSIFGFLSDGSTGEQVHVWSIHTLVYSYPSLFAFLEESFAPNIVLNPDGFAAG